MSDVTGATGTITGLAMLAMLLHTLPLFALTLERAVSPQGQDGHQLLKALFFGLTSGQRRSRSTPFAVMFACSGVLLAVAVVVSVVGGAGWVWTAVFTVLALTEGGCAYAWYRPGGEDRAEPGEPTACEDPAPEQGPEDTPPT
ncbi:hypothetical protein [Streptomyces sp. 7N604]|uniref:hypothetical protein n=1 Tax=Streptomyces sp. 7N604 TaxID=3457415 RepID=UPI003FD56308